MVHKMSVLSDCHIHNERPNVMTETVANAQQFFGGIEIGMSHEDGKFYEK